MKARRIAAITLLALSALWWMAFLVRDPYNDPRWLIHVGPPWVPRLQASLALPVVLTAAVGLACSRWWARMLIVSLALAVLFPAIMNAADAPVGLRLSALLDLQVAWAAALLICLRGRAFLAHYEGRAGADWQARGMRALWWAIVLNGMTLGLFPLRLIEGWQHWADCFATHYPTFNYQTPAYWPSLALTAPLLVGLGLLVRRKTIGLLVTALVSAALFLVLLSSLRGSLGASDARHVLLIPVPGLLAAGLVLSFVWYRTRAIRA